MPIVVNHLTRMAEDRICVAGIDLDSLEHVRPVSPPDDLMTRKLLRLYGGPFAIGALVDFGPMSACPTAPHTEDHRFAIQQARCEADIDPDTYLELLDLVSDPHAASAFGECLIEIRPGKLAVPAAQGDRSLAVVPATGARLKIEFDNLYLELDDAKLRVTDVRFYQPSNWKVRRDLVRDVNRRLRSGTRAYAMLGLARAIPDEGRLVHWLMANGVCLADHPVRDRP